MSASPSPAPRESDDLVSTIVPVRDRPVLVREAVASVLAQTHSPIEVIVVDDGSGPETRDAVDRLAEEHRGVVRAVHRAGGGPGRAREAGRRIARGAFVQHLDSDDVLMPDKFERQVAALRARPDAGACYGPTRYVRVGEGIVAEPWKRTGEAIESMFPAFLRSRWWGTSTPLYRRSVIDAAGPWTDLRNEEDWEYDCRIAALGVRLCRVEGVVSEQRDHAGARLSRAGSSDPAKLRDRAVAHEMILGHARRAGIGPDAPEMRRFARELFLLARQCGVAGLERESRRLLGLAESASGRTGWDHRAYRAVAAVAGWRGAGRLARAYDRARSGEGAA